VRSGDGLASGCQPLRAYSAKPAPNPPLALYELRNIHAVALLIAECGLACQGRRGVHFCSDFHVTSAEFEKHSRIARGNEVTFH